MPNKHLDIESGNPEKGALFKKYIKMEEKENVEVFDRYDLLCEDLKHQIKFIYDIYQFDFDHMNSTISEMMELQKKVRIG